MGAARVPARPSWGGVGALGAAWLLAAKPGPGHADGIPHCLKHQLQQAEGTDVPRAAAPWHGGSRVKARLAHGDRGRYFTQAERKGQNMSAGCDKSSHTKQAPLAEQYVHCHQPGSTAGASTSCPSDLSFA